MKKGVRKSFYVRDCNKWVLQAIQECMQDADQLGCRCTESDVIISALLEYLSKYKKAEVAELNKSKYNTCKMKRTIQCPVGFTDVFERIEELIKIKQVSGMRTSFSQELLRLAKSGLISADGYGKIVRSLLKTGTSSKAWLK